MKAFLRKALFTGLLSITTGCGKTSTLSLEEKDSLKQLNEDYRSLMTVVSNDQIWRASMDLTGAQIHAVKTGLFGEFKPKSLLFPLIQTELLGGSCIISGDLAAQALTGNDCPINRTFPTPHSVSIRIRHPQLIERYRITSIHDSVEKRDNNESLTRNLEHQGSGLVEINQSETVSKIGIFASESQVECTIRSNQLNFQLKYQITVSDFGDKKTTAFINGEETDLNTFNIYNRICLKQN